MNRAMLAIATLLLTIPLFCSPAAAQEEYDSDMDAVGVYGEPVPVIMPTVAPPVTSSGDSTGSPEATERYWTEERMKNAKPMEKTKVAPIAPHSLLEPYTPDNKAAQPGAKDGTPPLVME